MIARSIVASITNPFSSAEEREGGGRERGREGGGGGREGEREGGRGRREGGRERGREGEREGEREEREWYYYECWFHLNLIENRGILMVMSLIDPNTISMTSVMAPPI